ncbi:MAG: amidohydrolase family protein [Bosea sp. (in: a-proteobacteria)]
MTAIAKPEKVIDAHHHVWDLGANHHPWLSDDPPIPFRYGDYSAIRKTYMPADYRRDTAGWPVTGSVYVEAEWDRAKALDESRWIAAVAAEHGLPCAVVAWCDLAEPGAAERLAAHAAIPIVRGIRHKPAAAASPEEARRGRPGSMDDPAWRDGYAHLARNRLSYDLQTPWWHLDAAAELARDAPDTQIIVNHAALPSDRSPEGLAGWRRALELAAAEPNIALKISGIGRPGIPWAEAGNGPIIRDAIAIFGVERAMFASNFPVDGLVGDFDTIFSGFLAATADRSEDDRRKLFHDNAARFYRL